MPSKHPLKMQHPLPFIRIFQKTVKSFAWMMSSRVGFFRQHLSVNATAKLDGVSHKEIPGH